MDATQRGKLLAFSSAGAGLASWVTIALPKEGPLSHLADDLAWGLVVGALVLALLAFDALHARLPRALAGVGVALAALRGASLFLLP